MLPEGPFRQPVLGDQLEAHSLRAPLNVVIDAMARDGLRGVEGGPYAAGEQGRVALQPTLAALVSQSRQCRQPALAAQSIYQGDFRGVEANEDDRPTHGRRLLRRRWNTRSLRWPDSSGTLR
jgi:hypothetical protein